MTTQQRGRSTRPPNERGRQAEAKGRTAQFGNLTKDPELHYPDEGPCFARVGLAVERPLEEGNWQGERVTSFYELVVFGEMGEHLAQSCHKGCRVVLMGRAELETWTDDDGNRRTEKKILVDAIGPDLRWAVADVSKVANGKPKPRSYSGADYDEEPF